MDSARAITPTVTVASPDWAKAYAKYFGLSSQPSGTRPQVSAQDSKVESAALRTPPSSPQ